MGDNYNMLMSNGLQTTRQILNCLFWENNSHFEKRMDDKIRTLLNQVFFAWTQKLGYWL